MSSMIVSCREAGLQPAARSTPQGHKCGKHAREDGMGDMERGPTVVLKPCRKWPSSGWTTSANICRPGLAILYTLSYSNLKVSCGRSLRPGSATVVASGTSTHTVPPFCFSASSSGRTWHAAAGALSACAHRGGW